MLAGPATDSVTDDPEGAAVVGLVRDAWHQLPPAVQGRVHVASLPMTDIGENAAIVNALQRRAAVVVQKSLAEGFGLTVAEAMWKELAVFASAVGGIQDQIVDGESGVLLVETRATSQRSVAKSWTCWRIVNGHAGSASRHARVSRMSSWDRATWAATSS